MTAENVYLNLFSAPTPGSQITSASPAPAPQHWDPQQWFLQVRDLSHVKSEVKAEWGQPGSNKDMHGRDAKHRYGTRLCCKLWVFQICYLAWSGSEWILKTYLISQCFESASILCGSGSESWSKFFLHLEPVKIFKQNYIKPVIGR